MDDSVSFKPPKFRKLPDPDHVLYVKIDRWEWNYSLGQSVFEGGDPIDESDDINIEASVLHPSKPIKAKLPVRLRVLSSPGARSENRSKWPRRDVGQVYRIKGGFEGVILMPDDKLAPVIAMLSAGIYRFLQLFMVRAGRTHYLVTSYTFLDRVSDQLPSEH